MLNLKKIFWKTRGDKILIDKAFQEVSARLETLKTYINSLKLSSSVFLPDAAVDFNNQDINNVNTLNATTGNVTDLNISGNVTISSDDSGADLTYYNSGGFGGSDFPAFSLFKCENTVASPSVVTSGKTLFGYRGGGYTGTFGSAYTVSAGVFGVATENFSSTAAGSKLEFYYTPNTTRTLTLGLILNQDGNLTVGTVAGTGAKSLYLLDGNFAGAVYHVASTTSKPSGRIPQGTAPTSLTDGDYWHSSTQKTIRAYLSGITQNLSATLFTGTANANVVNTVTETTIIGTGSGSLALPANFFVAGKTIRITLKGGIETTGTPTLRIRIKLGSTTILDTTAITLVAITGTQLFEITAELTCRSTGASGSVMGEGKFNYFSSKTVINPVSMYLGTAVTVDTTAAQTIDVTAEWGTASSANAIRHRISAFEVLN